MPVPTWFTEFGIIGTWFVALVALFGDRLRAWWFKPKLHLELKSEAGKYSDQYERRDGSVITRKARYYHLRLTNRARYPKAEDVQMLLLGVERIGDKGAESGDLYVPLALGWADGPYPLARSIGSKTDAVADLLFVREDVLKFVLGVATPLNFQTDYFGETHLRVTAIARGSDSESNIVQLRIDWDGLWERDDEAMKNHLKIATIQEDTNGTSSKFRLKSQVANLVIYDKSLRG